MIPPNAPFRPLNGQVAVAQQVILEDVRRAADAGVRLIVCTREDGEQPGQPTVAAIAGEAKRLDIGFTHIPLVLNGGFPDAAVRQMRALVDRGGRMLGYCGSGKRVASLWALSQADRHQPEELIEIGLFAGVDLNDLRDDMDRWCALFARGI